MDAGEIRVATREDAAAVTAIYAPFVLGGAVSFERDPPDAAEMARRIAQTLATHPFVVYEEGDVRGYAYATGHRSRAAYRWSVEVSVYVAASARRRGVGRALYTRLFELLCRQGFVNAYAGIALPNQASEALHQSLGFAPVGVYRGVGYKLGQWRDVSWWSLRLREPEDPPRDPIPFAQLDA